MQIFVLHGEGIECENETLAALSKTQNAKCSLYSVPELLSDPDKFFNLTQIGDWIVVPGGFSFSDHFGSGRLLAFQLEKINLFKCIQERALNLLGICNGFQVLTQAGCFGEHLSLEPNCSPEGAFGFLNRWVNLKLGFEGQEHMKIRMSARHGEGRLVNTQPKFENHVKPFLFYDDSEFDNGSTSQIGGLMATLGESTIWGLMPHPEVSLRPIDDPAYGGPDFDSSFHAQNLQSTSHGAKVLEFIFSKGRSND